jgi:hypothetical protein
MYYNSQRHIRGYAPHLSWIIRVACYIRDIQVSNLRLLNDDKRYRCVSYDGEVTYENYIKIDNSELSAKNAAQIIKERFRL